MRVDRRTTIALLALPLIACSFGCAPEDDPRRPNVLLVVMDTARQDALSVYGAARETSPNLDALAREAATFDNAYATSTWTASSHASLFTGLFPVAHHCTQENWTLSQNLVTLAERLREVGYHSVAIVENPLISVANGFDQGFDRFHEVWKTAPVEARQNGETTTRLFEQYLDQRDPDEPFFGFCNLIGPHSPYNSSGDLRNRFLSDPSNRLESNRWAAHYFGSTRFGPRELSHLRELYDAELLAADRTFGRLVDSLRQRGLLDHTVVILTSDHGENIGDHGHMDHVFSLYDTTIKVPLMIRFPQRFAPGSRYDELVQLTDILPTVLALVGGDPAAVDTQGRDLAALDGDDGRVALAEYYRPLQVREALSHVPADLVERRIRRYDRRIRTIIRDGMKLIWGSDGRHELYDLSEDPSETHDLYELPDYAETRDQLLRVLMRTVEHHSRPAVPADTDQREPLDEQTIEALRSLGYLQ